MPHSPPAPPGALAPGTGYVTQQAGWYSRRFWKVICPAEDSTNRLCSPSTTMSAEWPGGRGGSAGGTEQLGWVGWPMGRQGRLATQHYQRHPSRHGAEGGGRGAPTLTTNARGRAHQVSKQHKGPLPDSLLRPCEKRPTRMSMAASPSTTRQSAWRKGDAWAWAQVTTTVGQPFLRTRGTAHQPHECSGPV